MIARRQEDGSEIYRRHPERSEIRQLFAYARRVAAEKVVGAVVLAFARDVGELVPALVQPAVFLAKLRLPRPREPVREDLVDYAAFCPIRGFIRLFRDGHLPFRQPFAAYRPAAGRPAEVERAGGRGRLEAVFPHPGLVHDDAAREHMLVPVEVRKRQLRTELLFSFSRYDEHLFGAHEGRQREDELRLFPRRRRSVRRLVCQRIIHTDAVSRSSPAARSAPRISLTLCV